MYNHDVVTDDESRKEFAILIASTLSNSVARDFGESTACYVFDKLTDILAEESYDYLNILINDMTDRMIRDSEREEE